MEHIEPVKLFDRPNCYLRKSHARFARGVL